MVRINSDDPVMMQKKILSDQPELARRISEMLARFPSRKAASRVAGKTQETITAWGKGEGLAQFLALAAVAAEVNISLDWLAFGGPVPDGQDNSPADTPDQQGPDSPPVRHTECVQLAEMAVRTTLDWLVANDIDLPGPMLARLISKSFRALMDAPSLYRMSVEDQQAVVIQMLNDGLDLLRPAGE